MIIALDLSLSCTGYSVFDDDGKFIITGHVETNKDDSTPLKLYCISKTLRKLKRIYKPKLILIEKGFYKFITSTQQIYRVNGITNLIFRDVEQIEIPATSVRKLISGHGNMKKEQLRVYIDELYPHIYFENNDEMDSFALGLAYFIQKGVLKSVKNNI